MPEHGRGAVSKSSHLDTRSALANLGFAEAEIDRVIGELDFYIKNEVMLLDDLDVKHIESQLNIIKAIKLVGEKIIRMLAQLEDFQMKSMPDEVCEMRRCLVCGSNP